MEALAAASLPSLPLSLSLILVKEALPNRMSNVESERGILMSTKRRAKGSDSCGALGSVANWKSDGEA